MGKQQKSSARYFAQVGLERIEVPGDHVELHQQGALFTTSAPVSVYLITDEINGTSYQGTGSSWEEADKALKAQIPKDK